VSSWADSVFIIYNLGLGNFDTEFGPVGYYYAIFLFILCTLFIMIIMLNLLIAIISEAFARIYEVSEDAAY